MEFVNGGNLYDFLFFFQAEDGIRDTSVTGVQTCALPILKIQVQNGTGTPGQAGTAVEAIKKAGYNSDNIKTANATNFNNSSTTISAKAGFERSEERRVGKECRAR